MPGRDLRRPTTHEGDTRWNVHAAQVDALDADAVERHAAAVVARTGHLDISFNLVGFGDAQGAALVDITADHFLAPIKTAMRAHFNTGTHRRPPHAQTPALGSSSPDVGGFGVAGAALEALSRQLAAEAGPTASAWCVCAPPAPPIPRASPKPGAGTLVPPD